MADDRRAFIWFVLGGTGSGKTFFARGVVSEYARKPDYLAIVNSSGQLREFARHHLDVNMHALERGYTAEQLKALLRRYGAVHFEVSTGAPYKLIQRFMDALGTACMELGKLPSNRCRVLLVIDECQNYINKRIMTDCRGMRRVLSEGRKFGVDALLITQQLSGTGSHLIDMDVRRMMTVVVVFNCDEPNERHAVVSTWGEFSDPGELMPPDPSTGRPAEYMIRDRTQKRAYRVEVSRGPRGWRRHAVPLLGRPGPPRRTKI